MKTILSPMKMIQFISISSILCFLLAAAASSAPAQDSKVNWEEKWKKTLAAAQKEGAITIYGSSSPEVRTEVAKAFKVKYGINIEYITARPPELAQKVSTDRRAGLYLADLFISGGTFLVIMLKPTGILEPIESALLLPEVTDLKSWRGGQLPFFDKEHTAIGFIGKYSSYLVQNTEMVKPKEITSYLDILKPQWKGKIVLQDPNLGGGGLWWLTFLSEKVWGQKDTRSFLEKLKAQDVAVVNDNRLQTEWVARGKYSIGLATDSAITNQFKRIGAPIANVRVVEGGLLAAGNGGIGLANKAPHPNGAIVFINWLLSREGQSVFTKAMGSPSVRLDAPKEGIEPSELPNPGEKVAREDEDFIIAASTKVKTMYNDVFGGK